MKVILKQFLHLLFDLARNDSNRRILISSYASSVITRVLSSHRMTIPPLKEKRSGNFSALDISAQLQQCARIHALGR